MCFWFEGRFVCKYQFSFRRLQCVPEERLSCSFLHASISYGVSFPPLFLPASKFSSNCLFQAAILPYVIGPRAVMKLSSEASCFLFIQAFWGLFVTQLQDSSKNFIVACSGLCFVCFMFSIRFPSELCHPYCLAFSRNLDSSGSPCLPAD